MKRTLKNITLAIVALGLSACVTPSIADKASISLTPESAQNRAGWTGAVNKMRKVFGAPIPEDQVKVIVDYLLTQNGTQ